MDRAMIRNTMRSIRCRKQREFRRKGREWEIDLTARMDKVLASVGMEDLWKIQWGSTKEVKQCVS